MKRRRKDPARAENPVLALIAVTGNVLGAAALGPVRLPYRLSGLTAGVWVQDCLAHPRTVEVSAFAFVAGLTALGLWALRNAGRFEGGPGWYGFHLLAFGSFADSLGSLLPWVVASRLGPEDGVLGGALLSIALAVDSLFNATLALGLPLIAWGLWERRAPAGLWMLALFGGLFSFIPSAEMVWDQAALGLWVSSPLWLVFLLWSGTRQAIYDL